MAVRVRQVTRTTQPQDAFGVARDNPLSSNLSAQYLPTRGDIVNSFKASSAGATFYGGSTTSVGPSGIGVKAVAYGSNAIGGDYVAVPASPENSLSAPLSWEILLSVGTLSSGAAFPFISGILTKDSPAARGCTLRFNPDATSGNYNVPCFIAIDSGGNETQAIGVGASAGQLLHLVGTWDGTTATLWQNGVAYTATGARTIATGATVPLAINTDFLGESFNLNRSSDHLVYYVRIWSEAVSAAKVAALYSNPWQLFEPEQIVVKAGASTTTVTVDAGSLTLTGQAVTDTVTAAVDAGTVTLTGQNVALQQQQPVTAGSTPLTGQSIGITITVPISPGTLSLTGSSVTVVPPSGSSTVTVDPGTLSLTGQAVTNLVTTPVSAGSTSLTGQNIGVTTTVNVSPGSITLTGQVVTVSYLGTQTIPVEPGTISVTGRDVTVSVTGGTKGGAGKGKNLTLKQKKKLKAVVSQEWLKAEQTVQELLLERLGHTEPAKVRVEKLTQSQSLLDVIDALKALSKETVTLPEQQAVIKTINKTITEKTIKQVDRTEELEKRMAAFEKRLVDIEEMVLVALSEIL